MSRIVNDSFQAGEVITAAKLNAKFDDVTTATTGSLDEANFATESIDLNQFNTSGSSGKSGTVLRSWLSTDNGLTSTGGTTYTSTVNTTAPVELSHGSGSRLVWAAGMPLDHDDVLRVDFAVMMQAIVNYTWALYPFVAYDVVNDPVWFVWLQWDVTSNALANWTEVPNQGDFFRNFVDAEGALTSMMQATLAIPHGWRYYDGVQRHNEDDGASSGTLPQTKMLHRRSYSYANTGGNVTIYGLRLVINGLYHAEKTANTDDENAFQKDNDATGWKDEQVKIAGVWHRALVMRSK